MPVFNPIPTAPPVAVDAPTRAMAPENKNIIVDSRYVPLKSLLSHVEGTPWTVDYYSQVVDKDTTLAGQQVNRLAINQQYRAIRGLELRVTSPLAQSQDTASNSMVLVGTANMFPGFIPNTGDMFTADIGDGKLGIFQLTASERKSVMKDTVHEINYQWVAYATQERLDDLNKKVVKTEVFVRDLLVQDKYPFLAEEDYNSRRDLQRYYSEIVPMYFKSFYDHEYATLLVPEQEAPTYDPLLVDAVLAIVDTSDSPDVMKVRQLNVGNDAALTATSIWTALLERSMMQFDRSFTRATTVNAAAFDRKAFYDTICHSGISYVVYPQDPERSVSSKKLLNRKVSIAPVKRPPSDQLSDILPVQILSGLDGATEAGTIQQAIPKACETDFYLFTEAFYNGTRAEQARLENLVEDYLKGDAISPAELLTIVRDYPRWTQLDQFYYGPVLMLLIKHVARSY